MTAQADEQGDFRSGSQSDDAACPRRWQLSPEAANPGVSAPSAAHVV
jgi:hypothetical protein